VTIASVLNQSPVLPTRSTLEIAARELGVELAWRETEEGLRLGLCGAPLRNHAQQRLEDFRVLRQRAGELGIGQTR